MISWTDITPVEEHQGVWFKREDLFEHDGMNGTKYRQLLWLMTKQPITGVVSGAVSHSPQLPMVASVAKDLGVPCVQFCGSRSGTAADGEALGASTVLVNPGYGPLLNRKAKDYAAEHSFLHVQTNITSDEIEPFHRVSAPQVQNIPEHIETLIIPAGSRNSAVSIIYGLHLFPKPNLKQILLLNINTDIKRRDREMGQRLAACGLAMYPCKVLTYDLFDGFTDYNKLQKASWDGIKFHGRYEAKCWNFLQHIQYPLDDKSLFWIVAGEI